MASNISNAMKYYNAVHIKYSSSNYKHIEQLLKLPK